MRIQMRMAPMSWGRTMESGNLSFIARQPIFDAGYEVFGYELLFRSGPENYFIGADGDAASRKVVSDSLCVHGLEALTAGRTAFVNVTRRVLIDEMYTILPPECTVLEVLETIPPDREVIRACRTARENGYRLALDDFVFDPRYEAFLSEVDIVKVDWVATTAVQRLAIKGRAEATGFDVLAEKVETYDDVHEAARLGCRYFQGFFFCTPEMIATRDIPAVKLNYLRLLDQINRPAVDVDELGGIIHCDTGLSYKLLKYLNSVGFGLRHRVNSIRHAITLLGEKSVRKWASLIALTSLSEDKPSELCRTSLIRARFCELVGQHTKFRGRELDLFVLGLFSVIDALLDRPMEQIVKDLRIWPEVKSTLLGETTTLSPVFELALALERGRWDQVSRLTHRLSLTDAQIPAAYESAILWAHGILPAGPGAADRAA
ncbi:MAG: HDOD domain-containing protein [Planctomycetota bacterium]|nr:HDOD domain-containing protein [Planctomycetota bacterium]